MKRFIILLHLLWPLFIFVEHTFSSDSPDIPIDGWTAKEAVQFALQQNPDSQIALQRIIQAEAVAKSVQASDYPLILIKAEYSQTNNPMYSFGNILNQGAFDDTIDFNEPGQTDNLLLKAEMLYRFYNGGRDSADQRRTEAEVEVANANMNGVHESLSFQVVKGYQSIIQALKMVDVRKEAMAAISASLEVGQARFEAGDMLKQDLLNLELQKSRESENLIRSSHNLELAKRSFLNLLGMEGQDLKINLTVGSEQSPPEVIDYSRRFELGRLQAIEAAASAAIEKARGSKFPSVDGFMSYQMDHGWELDESGDSWMAGVRVNYTLFDGNRRSFEVARSHAKLKEIKALLKKTELALSLDIENARLTYQQAKERLTVTSKIVEVAEEAARLARVRFKEGVILSSDLIDFEMRLTDGRARHLTAEADSQVAIANLRRATGYSQFADL